MDGEFAKMLREAGLKVLPGFAWSGRAEEGRSTEHDWLEAGRALAWFVAASGVRRVSGVAHSHGGNVLAHAAEHAREHGVELDAAVTVATPVREDMLAQYGCLRAASRRWTHIYSDETVKSGDLGYQQLGEVGLDWHEIWHCSTRPGRCRWRTRTSGPRASA